MFLTPAVALTIFIAVNGIIISNVDATVTQIGNIAINNEGIGDQGETISEDVIIVTLMNDCASGTSAEHRASELLGYFPCMTIAVIDGEEGYITFTHDTAARSYLMLDISNNECIDVTTDLSNLCIESIFNDFTFDSIDQASPGSGQCSNNDGNFGCYNAPTYQSDPSILYSWGLDSLDGTFDDQFNFYFACPDTVDIYVGDTGIISEHDDFYLVNDLYGSGWTSGASDGDHGTHVASIIGGIRYGVVHGNQIIHNVRVLDRVNTNTGRATGTFCGFMAGMQAIENNLRNTGRRGVINLSLAFGWWQAGATMMHDQFLQIIAEGGIPVVSAGNSAGDACTAGSSARQLPADLTSVITVGAHDASYRASTFTNYGSCVDIFAPGTSIVGARSGVNNNNVNNYGFYSGTSQSTPFVAGIITNWLLECAVLNYHTPCTFANTRTRLMDWTRPVTANPFSANTNQCGSTGLACNAVQYFCGRGLYPRDVEPCDNDPCAQSEAGLCNIYHSNVGCSQCLAVGNIFKIDYDYPCVFCRSVLGSQCLGCNDFQGCCQCSPNNHFELEHDTNTGLLYCKPQPCLNPLNNCRVCNNGQCSQCNDGYSHTADRLSCI